MKLIKIKKKYDKELSVVLHNGDKIVGFSCLKKLLKQNHLKHMDFKVEINEEGNTLTLTPTNYPRGQFKKYVDNNDRKSKRRDRDD